MTKLLSMLLFLTALGPYGNGEAALITTPVGYQEAAAALDQAIAAKDRTTLEALIADDFLWIRGSGAAGTKANFIAALTANSIRIEPFQPEGVRWFISDDSALITATNTLRGTLGAESFVDRHRYADLWLWRDGKWRLVYAQVTSVPDGSRPQ